MQVKLESRLHIISHEFPPYVGGSGVMTLSLLRGLERLGVEYSYLLGSINIKKSKEIFDTGKGIYIPFYKRSWFLIWPLLMLLYSLVITKRSDKLLILNFSSFQAYSLASKFIKRDVSLVLHGGDIDYIYGSLEYDSFVKRVFFSPKRLRHALLKMDKVFSVSEYFANYIERQYGFKTYSILNSVSENHFSVSEKEVLNVISVGRILADKGFDTTFSVLEELWQLGFEFTWKVVGDGDYLNDLKRNVELCEHCGKVEFYGAMPHAEVNKLLLSCQIFVLPSRLSETFGLVYAEAMAAGLVVFAPLRSGASDYINNGLNGFLVDSPHELKSQLVPVLKNYGDYEELRLQAVDTVKNKLSTARMTREYLNILYGDN